MKVPKIFVPEKNLEKNLENILSKKLYTVDKTRSKIMVHDLNGNLLDSKNIGERIWDLETFSFYNKQIFTVKFGDDLDNRAVFNKRLEPMIMTPSYPNQTYSVFERKNYPSLLMVNTATKRTKGTKITYYQHDGTELGDFYYEIQDTLTNKVFVVKTKKQNYLALCFNYHTLLIYEDLHTRLKLKTFRDVNDVHTVNLKGNERIIALCFKYGGPSYQVLKIFNNNLKLLEELNTETFKPTSPENPWYDKLLGFKPYKLGSKDYFFAAVERKTKKDRIDLKVLNTDFEEVFQLEGIVQGRFNVEKFNGKDHFFVLLNKGTGVVNVYDENFNLKDKILVRETSLQDRYKVIDFNGVNYLACVHEGNLEFYSGDIPFGGTSSSSISSFFRNKKVSTTIRLDDINSGLKKVIPFEYKGKDFLALEYDNNDGVDVYDEDFKFLRNFPGGDFCVA